MINIVHICHSQKAARAKFNRMEASYATKSHHSLEISDGDVCHYFVGQENFVSFMNSRNVDQLVISEYVDKDLLASTSLAVHTWGSRTSNRIVFEKRGTYEFC